MGFGDMASFEFLQRTAKAFACSTMVPTAYQSMVTKGYGQNQTVEPNPAAMSNCMIALDMAQRMNANPLQVMQNLNIIEGKPSWSSQFIIAAINASGKFSPLRFDLEWLGEMDATYSTFEWESRQKVEKKHKVRITNARCVAWAIEKATGERLESAPVTIEMAVNEGWYGKNGSKWRSMPDLMLRYRSAAFFGRIYAPELLMGLPTTEEVQDVFMQDADGNVVHAGRQAVPKSAGTLNTATGDVRQEPESYPSADFDRGLPGWAKVVADGRKSIADLVATLESKAPLTDEQKQRLQAAVAALAPQDAVLKEPTPKDDSNKPPFDIDPEALEKRLKEASDLDTLYDAADLIEAAPTDRRESLNNAFNARLAELEG
ncbi:MAG: hypothetical protein BGO66_02910 [Alicycliphilus sp. 69-12]|nr:MAG: hypothetical protein BGO66_02910 [Alicycliphilus sp. 69-12]